MGALATGVVAVGNGDEGDGLGGTGWVAEGVAAAGAVGVGEGVVTRSLTTGLDDLPRASAAAVIPPARTITASTTAHWGLVSLRSLVTQRLRTAHYEL
jgi:hypothetical protein